MIERTFGVFKHRFKILTTASEYKLEQQLDIVIACACVHNMNIIWNGQADEIFEEASQLTCAAGRRHQEEIDESYVPTNLLTDREREECENWRDGIAEQMWVQYVCTLERRHG